jgi:hypothetical protein
MKNIKLVGTTLLAGAVLLSLGACAKKETVEGVTGDGSESIVSTNVSGTEVEAATGTLNADGYFKDTITESKNPKIKSEATYNLDYSDSSWENVTFTMDTAKVVETDKFKEKDDTETYKGAMSIHYTLKNDGEREVKLHPDGAIITLNDGTEIKAKSFHNSIDTVFNKGEKEGYMKFKFSKSDEDKISEIKSISVNFKGHYTDGDKDKVDHEYNADLNPQVATSTSGTSTGSSAAATTSASN